MGSMYPQIHSHSGNSQSPHTQFSPLHSEAVHKPSREVFCLVQPAEPHPAFSVEWLDKTSCPLSSAIVHVPLLVRRCLQLPCSLSSKAPKFPASPDYCVCRRRSAGSRDWKCSRLEVLLELPRHSCCSQTYVGLQNVLLHTRLNG